MPLLWLRADASVREGLGHVMRSLALAETAVAAGWEVRFVVGGEDGLRLPQRRGFSARTATLDWADAVGVGDTVVFDGYHFGPADHRSVRDRACVAAVDDLGTGTFDVDVLLNPSVAQPEAVNYRVPAATRLLLGPRYALVRKEFREARDLQREDPTEGVLLVTLGGTDVADIGEKVVDALRDDESSPPILLLVGPATKAPAERPGVEIVRDPPRPADVFGRAVAAISAAGSTTWELLTMGVPSALIQVAENQTPVLHAATEAGAALPCGSAADLDALRQGLSGVLRLLMDPAERRRLSAAALALVDGQGAQRMLAAIESASQSGRARGGPRAD